MCTMLGLGNLHKKKKNKEGTECLLYFSHEEQLRMVRKSLLESFIGDDLQCSCSLERYARASRQLCSIKTNEF